MVDFRNGGTKLQSLSTGPGPSPLPVMPAGTRTQGATAGMMGAPPPQSQSYYETWGEACSTVACSACNTLPCTDLIGEGSSAIPYALPFIEIGGACGYEGVYSYGGSCLDQRQLIYAALGWAFGFIANSNHANQWGAVAVAMNNAGDSDPTTEYDNGAFFYLNLTGSLYDYVALLNAYNANHAYVFIAGADDVETGALFRGPSPSLNWLTGFSTEEYLQTLTGQPLYQMVIDGDSTNTCGFASCFSLAGQGDPQGWRPADVWMANWGIGDDHGSPQIYDHDRATVYKLLDAAAAAANAPGANPLPSWEQVIYGCPGPKGPAGDEPNANQSYTDFQKATGQAPTYLTDFHFDGDHSLTSCGG